MPDPHTPTTAAVRSKYATVLHPEKGWTFSPDWDADFQRWLDTVKADAWDEGHRFTGYEPARGENPYRKVQS